MIREGTAAKNLQELMPLFEAPYYNLILLVTDDKHPLDLLNLSLIHIYTSAYSLCSADTICR